MATPQPSQPDEARAQPGDVYHRHWKWFAFRAAVTALITFVVFGLAVTFLGKNSWLVVLPLLLAAPAVCYLFWLAWKAMSIEVVRDKLIINDRLIRTERFDIPIVNIQEYNQVYRSDLDRLLFRCVELRVTTAGESDNPAFYPIAASDASALTRFLDTGRREGSTDPSVRLQTEMLEATERLTAVMAVTARWLGAPQHIIEHAVAMADRRESLSAIINFVYEEDPTLPGLR